MPTRNPLDHDYIGSQVEPGLLLQLGRTGASGLSAVGNFLDLPGSMVRDALAFENPLDNLLNPFSSENRTSGRDLLREYGLVGKEDTYGNWWAGLGTEILADPLTYLSAGGLLAAKAGATAANVGAKGLLKASVPFTGKSAEVFTGATSRAVASGLGDFGRAVTRPSVLAPMLQTGADALKTKLPGVFGKAAKVAPAATKAADEAVSPFAAAVTPAANAAGAGEPLTKHPMGELPRIDYRPTNTGEIPLTDFGPPPPKPNTSLGQPAPPPPPNVHVTSSVGPENLEGWTRIYKPPEGVSTEEFFSTLEPNTLLDIAGRAIKSGNLQDFLGVFQEAGRRGAGGLKNELDQIVKDNPGLISYLDVKPKNIQDISSIVPKASPQQVSDWAKQASQILTAPGRAAAMLFHAPVRGAFTEEAQNVARQQWERISENTRKGLEMTSSIVKDTNEVLSSLEKELGADIQAMMPADWKNHFSSVEKAIQHTTSSILRHSLETGAQKAGGQGAVLEAIKEVGLNPGKVPAELIEKIGSLGQKIRGLNSSLREKASEMGMKVGLVEDIDEGMMELIENGNLPAIDYLPRLGAFSNPVKALMNGMTRPSNAMSRHKELRSLPSLIVEKIGKFVQTAQAGGLSDDDAITAIVDKYGKWIGRELKDAVDADGNAIKVPLWESPEAHAAELVKWGKNADNYETYVNNLLLTQSSYNHSFMTAMANMGGIHSILKDSVARAVMEAKVPDEMIPKGKSQLRGLADYTAMYGDEAPVSIAKVYSEAGMDPEKSVRWLAKELGASTEGEITAAVADILDHGVVPRRIADAVASSTKPWRLEGWAKTVAEISDIPTRWFKENVTLPFISFATRNLGSGQWMIASSGLIESLDDLKLYGQQVAKAFDGFRHGTISPESQMEWFTEGVLHEGTVFEGIQTRGGSGFGQVAPGPLSPMKAWQDAGEQIDPSLLDKVPGLRALRQTQGALLQGLIPGSGAQANKLVEYLNRVPLYEYLKKKGWSPQEAAKEVARLQIDYSKHAFSPFENEVMRRLFPFYSWQRKVAPVILGGLLRQPAGLTGLSIRASRLASSDDPRTPEWLGSTLAIENPLGSTEPGGRSYITGFGLPYEPTLEYFTGARGAGQEILSQLNPLIKAPMEWATGQSFFQRGPSGAGRPLDELNPPIGQTLANVARFTGRDPSEPVDLPDAVEFAAANSPFTRYITTARQLTDPRKHPLSLAANMLTGVRATDVSPAAQDSILRHRVNALTKELGGREFRQSYIPSSANLTPAEQGLAEQLNELRSLLDRRSRARRKEAELAG